MPGRGERVTVTRFPVGVVSLLAVLVGGCEGDLPMRMMQRDLDSVRSDVAVVYRTSEGERGYVEERLGRLEVETKGRIEKARQEKAEEVAGLTRSQTNLNTKLDDLTAEARLTLGKIEEIGHRISELNKRIDAVGGQVGQFGRRLDGFEKQLTQAVATAQEAKVLGQTATATAQGATSLAQQATGASQQTAQDVTNALQQMAEQTNAAVQQVNATTQLALTEARKASAAKQFIQPIVQQAPAVAKVPLPPPISLQATAAPPPPAPASPPRPAVTAATPAELYKNALNDYTEGNYDLAIEGFRSYITLYPKTTLLPNAHYWLGESFYRRKNHDLAIKQFELFLKDYPKNAKAASAMLKQGYAYLEMGDTSRGRTVLTRLVKRFPRSREAKSAKDRLSQVKKGLGSSSGAPGLSRRAS
jgi:tol-pal system protein YbgF